MTTDEKLLRAKTDIDEVHEAGYSRGYNEAMNSAASIEYDSETFTLTITTSEGA